MKAVNIFCGIDGVENFLGVHLFGEWELDEDGVHFVAAIEIADDGLQFGGGNCGGRSEEKTIQAEIFAGGDFAGYVDLGGGIVADEDGGEAGNDSAARRRAISRRRST